MILRLGAFRCAERNALGTIVAIYDMLASMEKHYHVWVRSGLVFMFKAKPYKSRAHANKVAAALRPDPDDRMVRACVQCPEPRRSRRRPPRWSRVAAEVAEVLDAHPTKVHRALVAALRNEKSHRRNPSPGPTLSNGVPTPPEAVEDARGHLDNEIRDVLR